MSRKKKKKRGQKWQLSNTDRCHALFCHWETKGWREKQEPLRSTIASWLTPDKIMNRTTFELKRNTLKEITLAGSNYFKSNPCNEIHFMTLQYKHAQCLTKFTWTVQKQTIVETENTCELSYFGLITVHFIFMMKYTNKIMSNSNIPIDL